MTALRVIEIFNSERENDIAEELKKQWLSELDRKIVGEILNAREGLSVNSFTADSDLTTELNAPEEYAEIYVAYLNMKADYMLGEISRYNNSAALFNRLFYELAVFVSRTFKSAKNTEIKVANINV